MIQDIHLIQCAKAANSESYEVMSHLAVGTDTLSLDVTDTSLDGEIGTRGGLTGSRSGNGLELRYLRTSAGVVATATGDDLKGVALFDAVSAGNMHVQNAISGLVQSTNYDVEFVQNVTYLRG